MSIRQYVVDQYGKHFIIVTGQQTLADVFTELAARNLSPVDTLVVVVGADQDYRVATLRTVEEYVQAQAEDALFSPLADLPYTPDEVLQLDTPDSSDEVIQRLQDLPDSIFLVLQGQTVIAVLNNSSMSGSKDVLTEFFLNRLKSAAQRHIGDNAKSPLTGMEQASATDLALEEVRFTAFRPDQVVVGRWYSLLVYAHILSALEAVRADAGLFKQKMDNAAIEVQGKVGARLARGMTIRVVPMCNQVTFNPESITIRWLEDWQQIPFRFCADLALAGSEDTLLVAIYLGPVVISQIKLAMRFNNAKAHVGETRPSEGGADIYRADRIFLSYCEEDAEIVHACLDAYKRLGFTTLIDSETLKSGQDWKKELNHMIDQADIFQLFWSTRAMQSKYVRREWEYALNKSKTVPGFIRPTYWEKPLAPIPGELAHLHFAYVPLTNSG